MVMIQTPTTRLVFRSDTTCGSPTTTMLESRVAMKNPNVVTLQATQFESQKNRQQKNNSFSPDCYEAETPLPLHVDNVLKPPQRISETPAGFAWKPESRTRPLSALILKMRGGP